MFVMVLTGCAANDVMLLRDAAETGRQPPPPGLIVVDVQPGDPGMIRQESGVCWLAGGWPQVSIDVLGLDSGTVARLADLPTGVATGAARSIFLDRGRLVLLVDASGAGGRLVTVDARTGLTVGVARVDAEELHRAGGKLFDASSGGAIRTYDRYFSARDVLRGAPVRQAWSSSVSQLGNGDAALPATWHATDEVHLLDPATGRDLQTIALEGFDTWVTDVQHTGRRLYLLDDGRGGLAPPHEQTFSVFHGRTGANLANFVLGGVTYGSFYCAGVGP